MDINDFFKKYCRNCKDICDRGVIEKEKFIRCLDRDIYIDKASGDETILKNTNN